MKEKYLDKIIGLLKQTHPKLAATHKLRFRNFFGAVVGYIDNNIFISCGKFGIALKLPGEVLDNLFKEGDVMKLQYFPNGHIKKEYAVLPKRIMEDRYQLRELVEMSIQFTKRNVS